LAVAVRAAQPEELTMAQPALIPYLALLLQPVAAMARRLALLLRVVMAVLVAVVLLEVLEVLVTPQAQARHRAAMEVLGLMLLLITVPVVAAVRQQ
jgi:hypothetical protein